MSGKPIVITGPSASGKTSIVAAALKKIPDSARLITTTTRPMRPGEIGGQDYFFISRKDFEQKIKEQEFFEYAEVYGNLYGSSKKVLEKFLNTYNYVLAVIDIQGAQAMKKLIPNAFVIFINPGSLEDITRRLETDRDRKNTKVEELDKRIETARQELSLASLCDAVVENKEGYFEKTVENLLNIIRKI